jgi:hypothetical protein
MGMGNAAGRRVNPMLLRVPMPVEEINRFSPEKRRDLTWRKSAGRGGRMMSLHGNPIRFQD